MVLQETRNKEVLMQFHIEGMTCGGCARSVTKAITSLDQDARVEADPTSRTVKTDTSMSSAEILGVLAEAGYPATEC